MEKHLLLKKETSIATLSDAVTEFVHENNLTSIDAVGSSMGARLVLELARRGGVLGNVGSLNPGAFGKVISVIYSMVQLHYL